MKKTSARVRVKADPQEMGQACSLLEVQRKNLRQASFFQFRYKRFLREKVARIEAMVASGEVDEMVLDVPGFVFAKSAWKEGLKRYFTEIDGLVCEIDEAVHGEILRVETAAASPCVVIHEFPEGQACGSITLRLPAQVKDISQLIEAGVPNRAVFPGSFATIVSDINRCTEGLFPHEVPDYLTDCVYWFHFHDECWRFASAWAGG